MGERTVLVPGRMKRRAVLVLATMAAALVLAGGVALAITKQCQTEIECIGTPEGDELLGTSGSDWMFGRGGGDVLKGFGEWDGLQGEAGNDELLGGAGGDDLYGGPGTDALKGQGDGDAYRFETGNWGRDTITDASASDNDHRTGNGIFFERAVGANLRITLVSSPERPEVTDAAGANTANWSNNVIDNVYNDKASGDDTIDGNPAANFIRSEGGKDDVYAGGGNDHIDVSDGDGGDFVNCGGAFFSPDNDTVFYDGPTQWDLGDVVRKCENKNAF